MTAQDDKIKILEKQSGDLRDRVAKIEGRLEAPTKSPNAALITILSVAGAGLLLFLGWVGSQVNAHGQKLTEIETKLTVIGLKTQAALPANTFEKTLPDLKSAVAAARKQDLRVSPKVIRDLEDKLIDTSDSAPSFWPTAAEFINYRSFALTGISLAQAKKLPDCKDTTPKISEFGQSLHPSMDQKEILTLHGHTATHTNCHLTLDSPDDSEYLNRLLKSDVQAIGFNRCVISYRGGPIKLTLYRNNYPVDSVQGKNGASVSMSVTGNTLFFYDCLWDVSIQESNPSEQARQLAKLVLTQRNASTIELPFAPGS
jgi:hypothetical protein